MTRRILLVLAMLPWVSCQPASSGQDSGACAGPEDRSCGSGCQCVSSGTQGTWRCDCEILFPTDTREVPLAPDSGPQDDPAVPADPGFPDRPEPSEDLSLPEDLPEDLLVPDTLRDIEPADPAGDPGAADEGSGNDVLDVSPGDPGPGDPGQADPSGDAWTDPGDAGEDACGNCPDAGFEACGPCGPWDVPLPDLPVPLCGSDEECLDGNPCTSDRCDPWAGCLHAVLVGSPCDLACGTRGQCSSAGTCVGQELCNGIDDDCDGLTDEDLGTTTCGTGACRVTVDNCRDGVRQVCIPGSPSGEVCNGIDDDCDGLTDEDLGQVTCGLGICQVTVDACRDGLPVPCVPPAPGTEACNGLDDDCDGLTDEDLGTTACGTGACRVTVDNCRDGIPQDCIPGSPTGEICNGLDDDCDGLTDEDLGTTTCGTGACRVTVDNCRDGRPQDCIPPPGSAESCNEVDDDCNGLTDEPWPQKGGRCVVGVGQCRREGIMVCRADGTGLRCSQDPGDPQPEACNLLDDDCDGDTDEDGSILCDDQVPCTEDTCHQGACIHPVQASSCRIGGVCMPAGFPNPFQACLSCQPAVRQDDWTPRTGSPCDDGDPCTGSDTCNATGGCAGIPWNCAQPNPLCGGDGCYCDAAARTRCLDDGLPCTDEICQGGLCTHPIRSGWCLIDGACVPDGALHPTNGCLSCQESVQRTAWTPRNGLPCDDGDPCTSGETCDGSGQCQPSAFWSCAQPNPTCGGDGCYCNPAARTRCGDDGLDCTDEACVGLQCTHPVKEGRCLIHGNCLFEGTVNPEEFCQSCQSAVNRETWSPRTGTACNDGNLCTKADTCNSQGLCVGTTMTCTQPNPNCGGDDCYCNPSTKRKCVDDGLSCTIESCNASQACVFTVSAGFCAIDGRCWRSGEYNPYDYCLYCNPSYSQVAWYYDYSCNY